MQKIDRIPLSEDADAALKVLQARVSRSRDQRADVQKLWKNLPLKVRRDVMETLQKMASGLERCMYCEDSQGTDIEHFRPKNEYPEFAFIFSNYLLACSHCNSNHKRSKFPLSAQQTPLLIDPTSDDPADHLTFSPTTGILTALDDRGQTSIDVCGLNREICVAGRFDAWFAMEVMILHYASLKRAGDDNTSARVLAVLRRYPFQSVRTAMAKFVLDGRDDAFGQAGVAQTVRQYPELAAE